MSINTLQPRNLTLILMVAFTVIFRVLQSSDQFSILSNVTAAGAAALFGGCYFHDRWKAFLVPLLALWISDIFINRLYYSDSWLFMYQGFYWVYGSFALMVVIGRMIKKVTATSVIIGAVSGALVHWLVSDFGVWLGQDLYTKDLSGLLNCYFMALPFLRNMLVGNLIFCGILFGAFEWMQRRYPSLQVQNQ